MSPAVQDFLLDWLARMICLLIVLASYTAVYFVARWQERMAGARRQVLAARDAAIAETVVIPRPRDGA